MMSATGQELQPLTPIDVSKEDWVTRLIYWFFDKAESACDFAMRANPAWRALEAEAQACDKEIAAHAAEMRRQYPEAYAEADRELRRNYFHLDN